jgi:hypothetical protein
MDKIQDLFKDNPILSKIGTPEQYREYLKAIFPNSKIKDIVYHGSYTGLIGKWKNRIYFSTDKEYAKNVGFGSRNVKAYVIDINNPYYTKLPIAAVPVELKDEGKFFNPVWRKGMNDSVIGKDYGQEQGETIAVLEGGEIHELASKEDLKNFKTYVSKQNKKMSFSKLFTKDWWTETLQLDEEVHDDRKETINEFVKYAVKELDINTLPKVVVLSKDQQKAQEKSSFGSFDPNTNEIWVYIGNRNLADVCRTLSHELTHHKQNEMGLLGPDSGKTGSPIENQANQVSGIIMREFGKLQSQIYESKVTKNGTGIKSKKRVL